MDECDVAQFVEQRDLSLALAAQASRVEPSPTFCAGCEYSPFGEQLLECDCYKECMDGWEQRRRAARIAGRR